MSPEGGVGIPGLQGELERCAVTERRAHHWFMHDFRRLIVWERSRELVVALQPALRRFPREDHGVLASQLRRAALSISANIAEGCGKSSRKETIRFLQIAAGSATEMENHLLIASELSYLDRSQREALLGLTKEVQRMLHALMKRLPE